MTTAIFVDLENVVMPSWAASRVSRDRPHTATTRDIKLDERELSVTSDFVEGVLAQVDGSLSICKTYGFATTFRGMDKLTNAGFNHIHVPGAGNRKNASDIAMVTDIMRTLYCKPGVERYVIVSGDSDFTPVIQELREEGKTIVVIGNSKTSQAVRSVASSFLLISELGKSPTNTPQLRGMQPPGVTEPPKLVPPARAPKARAHDLLVRAWLLGVPLRGTADPLSATRTPVVVWRLIQQFAVAAGVEIPSDMTDFWSRNGGTFAVTDESIMPRNIDMIMRRSDFPRLEAPTEHDIHDAVLAASGSAGYVKLDKVKNDVLGIIGPNLVNNFQLTEGRWNLGSFLNLYVDTVTVEYKNGAANGNAYKLRPTSRAEQLGGITGFSDRWEASAG